MHGRKGSLKNYVTTSGGKGFRLDDQLNNRKIGQIPLKGVKNLKFCVS